MSHMIMIDEPAIKECVESNIFQSPHFEAGTRLAQVLGGDKTISLISPRLGRIGQRMWFTFSIREPKPAIC